MSVTVIIAAGGSGTRFLKSKKAKGNRSKLFFSLGGKPVLAHALEAFREIREIREILLAVPRGSENWIRKHLLSGGGTRPPVRLVRGGRTRAESVRNALRKSSPQSKWILVHDGARPFPPRSGIVQLLRKRHGTDGILLGRPVIPTLKEVAPRDGRILGTVDRSRLFEAETPQLVRRSLLLKAYRKNPSALLVTDESSLLESVGAKVRILPHSSWNVKITTPHDLALAEAYHASLQGGRRPTPVGPAKQSGVLRRADRPVPDDQAADRRSTDRRPFGARNEAVPVAIGLGRDTHRLVAGRPFYLGGRRIPFEKGTLGHSDGDALLHAIADALLGALGLGDLGDWFPPTDSRFKNLRSEKFLKRILKGVRKEGWQPERIDSVIILERPKLGPYKERIQKEVSRILEMPAEGVSIKAKTQEGLGPEGEGRAVTCEALVLLRRFA
jgi:2-C-methyl-D-erythritol 4-phosphate cytidylyltransferase/2-C-methyl-D-erythritol 2,4-cyclodiphosphate synthase